MTLAFRQVSDGVFLNAQASMLYVPLSFWSKWPMLTKKTSSSVSSVTLTLLSGPEEGINTSVLGDSWPDSFIGCRVRVTVRFETGIPRTRVVLRRKLLKFNRTTLPGREIAVCMPSVTTTVTISPGLAAYLRSSSLCPRMTSPVRIWKLVSIEITWPGR